MSDNRKHIKFYKNKDDKNYSYITFENMYNIKQNTNFNFNDYNYIEVKYGFKALFKSNENSISILKEYSNPDQFNLGQSILRQDITGDEDSNNNWKDRVNVIEIVKLEVYCRGEVSKCKYKEDENGKPVYYKRFNLYYGDDEDSQNCYDNKVNQIGSSEANELYGPLMNDMNCDSNIDKVKCKGSWSTCDVQSDNKYKKKWNTIQKSFGNESCIDEYNNIIHTENISGCGFGINQGFNNEEIYINCNPYNSKFINDGTYFRNINGNIKYYDENDNEILNESAVGTGTGTGTGTGINYEEIGSNIIENPGESCN